MLRVRLAHQGETDATVKLNKAQRRVAELCTELTLAKRHIQHLTETETEVRVFVCVRLCVCLCVCVCVRMTCVWRSCVC